MPLMIIDLRLPTSGTVVATDASEYGQGVCRAVGLTAAGRLEAKRLEAQRAQHWDNRIGLVDMLGGLSSWRAAFDELGIQPAIFAFVGGRATSNRIVSAAWPDVFVLDYLKCDVPLDDASYGLCTKRHPLVPWQALFGAG